MLEQQWTLPACGDPMNSPIPHLISVDIRINESGWFVATSADCPGLFIADPSRERVVALIPEGIELMYQVRDNVGIKAIRLTKPAKAAGEDDTQIAFAAIPADTIHLHQTA
jgi:hypothetical protein